MMQQRVVEGGWAGGGGVGPSLSSSSSSIGLAGSSVLVGAGRMIGRGVPPIEARGARAVRGFSVTGGGASAASADAVATAAAAASHVEHNVKKRPRVGGPLDSVVTEETAGGGKKRVVVAAEPGSGGKSGGIGAGAALFGGGIKGRHLQDRSGGLGFRKRAAGAVAASALFDLYADIPPPQKDDKSSAAGRSGENKTEGGGRGSEGGQEADDSNDMAVVVTATATATAVAVVLPKRSGVGKNDSGNGKERIEKSSVVRKANKPVQEVARTRDGESGVNSTFVADGADVARGEKEAPTATAGASTNKSVEKKNIPSGDGLDAADLDAATATAAVKTERSGVMKNGRAALPPPATPTVPCLTQEAEMGATTSTIVTAARSGRKYCGGNQAGGIKRAGGGDDTIAAAAPVVVDVSVALSKLRPHLRSKGAAGGGTTGGSKKFPRACRLLADLLSAKLSPENEKMLFDVVSGTVASVTNSSDGSGKGLWKVEGVVGDAVRRLVQAACSRSLLFAAGRRRETVEAWGKYVTKEYDVAGQQQQQEGRKG